MTFFIQIFFPRCICFATVMSFHYFFYVNKRLHYSLEYKSDSNKVNQAHVNHATLFVYRKLFELASSFQLIFQLIRISISNYLCYADSYVRKGNLNREIRVKFKFFTCCQFCYNFIVFKIYHNTFHSHHWNILGPFLSNQIYTF